MVINKTKNALLRYIVLTIIMSLIISVTTLVTGFADDSFYKLITQYKVSDVDVFPDTIPYGDGVYAGHLKKKGPSTFDIINPADSKQITIDKNTGSVLPSDTLSYTEGEYTGTLQLTNYETKEFTGHYVTKTETKLFTKEKENTFYFLYSKDGKLIDQWSTWDSHNDHGTYPIDEDGYVGEIPKDTNATRQIGETIVTNKPDGTRLEEKTWLGVYSGELSKEVLVWEDYEQPMEEYVAHYSGTISKAAKYAYKQVYEDTLYTIDYKESQLNIGVNCEANGDPVNVVTGSFYMNATDLNIPDRGLPLEIVRAYNSVDERNGIVGNKWRINYDSSLSVKPDTADVKIIYPDGHAIVFKTIASTNEYQAPDLVYDTLTKNQDGTYKLQLQNKLIYTYSSSGKLISITDKNGNSVTLQYDSSSRLQTVTSATGKKLTFTYYSGRIKTISDPLDRMIVYSYDDNGNLQKVKGIGGGVTTYEYDNSGITAVIDENNKKYVENQYDSFNRVKWQKDENQNITEFNYDDVNRENTVTFLATGNITKYAYNINLYITRKTFNDTTYEEYGYDANGNRDNVRDRNGNVTSYVFDQRGNNESIKSAEPFNYTTIFTYDENDNLKQVDNPDGSITKYDYDANHNLRIVTQKLDDTTDAVKQFDYDNYGRVLSITDAENNTIFMQYNDEKSSMPNKIIDAEDNVISIDYDAVGRRTHITNAYGTTTFQYNSNDKVEKIIDPLGNVTRLKYDIRGNLIKKINAEQYNSATDDGIGYSYVYDGMDRLIKETNPLSYIKAYKFDAEGNRVKDINPNYYNAQTDDGLGTSYSYDESGRITKITNPSGQQSRLLYDPIGNVVKYIDANQYNESTDSGLGKEFRYDTLNRLAEIIDPAGNVIKKYEYDEAGRVIKEIDAKGYISAQNGDINYGTVYKYNIVGWMIEKREPLKNENGVVYYRVTKYKYDKNGKVIEEKKTPQYITLDGEPTTWHTISYSYYKNGNLKTISDSTGAYMEYAYDAIGNVISQRSKINDSKYQVMGYHYDVAGRLDKSWVEADAADLFEGGSGIVLVETKYEYDKNGNLTKVTSPEGYVTEYEYNEAGEIKKKKEPFEYDTINAKGTSISITSPRKTVYPGQRYEYKVELNTKSVVRDINIVIDYDARFYEVTEGTTTPGISVNTSTLGKITIVGTNANYTADTVLSTLLVKVKDNVNGIGHISINSESFYIDADGKNCEFTELISKAMMTKSPDMNNDSKVETNDLTLTAVEKGIDTNNVKFDEKYDIDGSGLVDLPDLNYIKDWLFQDKGKQITVLDTVKFNQKESNAVYNSNSIPTIRETLYDYDKVENLVKETDCNSNSIGYTYDAYNRLTAIKDKEDATLRIFYDEVGNKVKEVLPENYNPATDDGQGTVYGYDELNRLTTITDASGKLVRKNVYDLNGNVTKLIDAKGYISATDDAARYGLEYQYDIGNRVISVITPESKDKGKVSSSYIYNALDYTTSYTDGENNTTLYERDFWGNIIKVKDALGIYTNYEYDLAGNLTSFKDGNLRVTKYSYNSMNKLASITDPANRVIGYKYDKEGRLVAELDRSGQTIRYIYNRDNQIKERSIIGKQETENYFYNLDGSLLAAVNANSIDQFTYTKNGQTNTHIRNGKLIAGYEYNKNGSLKTISDSIGNVTSYNYDMLGRLETVSDNGQMLGHYEYNNDDTIFRVSNSNGVSSTYGYDKDKNITSIVHKGAQDNILNNFAHTYDNNGNQLTKQENNKTTIYTYDKLQRLATVQYPERGLEKFAYDNVGNMKSRTLGADITNYVYDTRNRLVQSTNNGIITTYGYDNNGNMIEENKNGVKKAYDYDGFNRLTGVVNADGSWQSNVYDALGYRMRTTENGLSYDYTFQDGNIIAEVDGNTQQATRFIRGINLIGQINPNGNTNYYLNNAHGDIVGLTDANGQVVNNYQYDAFGSSTSYVDKVANRFRYAGEQFDKISGQYYLRARHYNPEIARFISEDTYRGRVEEPLSLNLYTYVTNNPIKYIDPTGHDTKLIMEGGGGGGGLIEAITLYLYSTLSSPDTQMDLQFIALDVSEGDYFSAAIDAGGALIPGVTGTGKCSKEISKTATKLIDWLNGGKKNIDEVIETIGGGKIVLPFKHLKKIAKGTGLEVHHLIEKRFADILGLNPDDILSVALDKETHKKVTKLFREKIGYRLDFRNPTRTNNVDAQDVWDTIQDVYEEVGMQQYIDMLWNQIKDKGLNITY